MAILQWSYKVLQNVQERNPNLDMKINIMCTKENKLS